MIGTANASMKVQFQLTVDFVKHRVLKNGKVRQLDAAAGTYERNAI